MDSMESGACSPSLRWAPRLSNQSILFSDVLRSKVLAHGIVGNLAWLPCVSQVSWRLGLRPSAGNWSLFSAVRLTGESREAIFRRIGMSAETIGQATARMKMVARQMQSSDEQMCQSIRSSSTEFASTHRLVSSYLRDEAVRIMPGDVIWARCPSNWARAALVAATAKSPALVRQASQTMSSAWNGQGDEWVEVLRKCNAAQPGSAPSRHALHADAYPSIVLAQVQWIANSKPRISGSLGESAASSNLSSSCPIWLVARLCTASFQHISHENSTAGMTAPRMCVRPTSVWFACEATAVQRALPSARLPRDFAGALSRPPSFHDVATKDRDLVALLSARTLLRKVSARMCSMQASAHTEPSAMAESDHPNTSSPLPLLQGSATVSTVPARMSAIEAGTGSQMRSAQRPRVCLQSLSWMIPSMAWVDEA